MSFRLLGEIWRDIRGTAIVEGSILFPVLFVLILGVFEFSWYFYEQHRVSTGIRDAARYIARSYNVTWPNLNAGAPTIPTNVQSNAQKLATTGDTSQVCVSPGTGPTCRVAGWLTADVTISDPVASSACTAPDYCQGGWQTMYVVEVSTSFTPNSLGFLGFLNLGILNIRLSHTERLTDPSRS